MQDRTRIAALAVVTVPLAAWALLGGPGGDSSAGERSGAPASRAPAPAPAPEAPAPAPAPESPSAATVVQHGSGSVVPVSGTTAASGPGRVRRYTVAVEAGLGVDADDVARQVDRTLADPRSWGHAGAMAFQRVDSGPADVHVVLASPDTADRLCRPLDTAGIYSCGVGSTAVLNSMRWLRGADAYAGRLAEYRQYVVNHEVGHTLGHGHEPCRGAGRPAPVMMQQTKGVGVCLPSPWPFP